MEMKVETLLAVSSCVWELSLADVSSWLFAENCKCWFKKSAANDVFKTLQLLKEIEVDKLVLKWEILKCKSLYISIHLAAETSSFYKQQEWWLHFQSVTFVAAFPFGPTVWVDYFAEYAERLIFSKRSHGFLFVW